MFTAITNELSLLFDTVHAYNCKAGIELVPLGMKTEAFDVRDKAGRPQIEVDPSLLTKDQIHEIIED